MSAGELPVELIGVENRTVLWAEVWIQQELFSDLATFDALGKPDLFLHGEEISVTDLLEIEADRIPNT
jgi:hypothetical protein